MRLEDGRTIDFAKMKSFEIVQAESLKILLEPFPIITATVQITLSDGTAITAMAETGCFMSINGKTDTGTFELSLDELKRVDFER